MLSNEDRYDTWNNLSRNLIINHIRPVIIRILCSLHDLMSISCFPRDDLTDWVLALLSVSDSEDEDEQWLVVIMGLSSSFLPHFVNKGLCGSSSKPFAHVHTYLAWEEIRKRRRAAAPRPSCPWVHPSITRCTGLSELAVPLYGIYARPAATWLPACRLSATTVLLFFSLVLFSCRCHGCLPRAFGPTPWDFTIASHQRPPSPQGSWINPDRSQATRVGSELSRLICQVLSEIIGHIDASNTIYTFTYIFSLPLACTLVGKTKA